MWQWCTIQKFLNIDEIVIIPKTGDYFNWIGGISMEALLVGMKLRNLISLSLLALLLSGCGGGGGGSADGTTNNSPVADAGENQTINISGSETSLVTLTGNATDSDGTIVSQLWEQIDGTDVSLSGADTATATFTVDATPQTYTFKYTVTDDDGASGSDSISVTISTLTNDAGADQNLTLAAAETRTITLTGTSSDSYGTIVTHLWEQIDGTDVSLSGADTATATFTVDATPQAYTFRYTVTDNLGAQSSDEVNVIISLNGVPVANAGSDQAVNEGDSVTLSGSNSIDSDGSIDAYAWVQTAGTTATLSNAGDPQPTFTAPDVADAGEALTFQLTVTDDLGDQATDTVVIYVAGILFSDSFASLTNWTFVDATGNGDNWILSNNTLLQTDYLVNDESFANRALFGSTSYHTGSYALLDDGIIDTADYRFSVNITPETNLDSEREGYDVGVMFRYQDASNYYRVSMNSAYGFTRLERFKGGAFSTLAVNAIGYIDDQQMNMTVEANGNTIIIWIDDDPIFALVDNAPVSSGKVALYCQDRARFDDVTITGPSLKPTVVISSPLAYSVTPNDTLDVEAVVLNSPTGGRVVVTLDGGSETSATLSGNYYTKDFSGLDAIDHDIMVSLRDADGEEVSGDINSMVGTGGDYIVTVGDSITNGIGDVIPADNDSADGRIVSIQGFQALLSNKLTDTTGLPQIVFNEGIAGETAADMVNRIHSILARHPGANKVLMMIGTNDSYNVPAATFGTRVGTIATTIENNGNQLWIAKPMKTYLSSDPTVPDDVRNDLLDQYNLHIDMIVSSHTHTSDGPNFYSLFDTTVYYFDHLHPNNTGYGIMADQWKNKLTN